MPGAHFTLDANEAVARVAYAASEVIAIYPITPASPMGEWADEWAAGGRPNLWGRTPQVIEMQSEGGAAGTVHGALQGGALATTFTASQGLLLMIPNLYKIAGELTPCVIHVAARTLATHALSIFGDHSDVMACRQAGWAMLCAGSVQEAQDFAAIAHAATLESRVPILHFFDGFRTSHEVARIESLPLDTLHALLDDEAISRHRRRALSPDHPVVRGTAHNPDTYFQAREAVNPYYLALPGIVAETMHRFAEATGRRYGLYEYHGHPEAERVIVLMGSGAETVHEAVDHLASQGEAVGLVRVRLFRPFAVEEFAAALPRSVRSVAVLDRTREPGSAGEPLYQDVLTALVESWEGPLPRVVGGRFGLSSKEFTPAMVRAVFEELATERPRNHFTVGIHDDVSHTSLPFDPGWDIEPDDTVRAVFYGLGSDGTVGSNKNTIKIIGEETGLHAQGYFVYDSKKAGAMTVSHLRFGPHPIRSAYLIRRAGFVACHQPQFLDRVDVLECAGPGATFLLNTPHPPERVWSSLPLEVQRTIIERGLRLWVVDAYRVAEEAGLGRHLSTVMQTCFFALSGVLSRDEAIVRIKAAAEKAYGRRGTEVVRRNWQAIDSALDGLREVPVPARAESRRRRQAVIPPDAPEFVRRVTAAILEGRGDLLPVSAFPPDGTWPTGTSRWERRGIARELPLWDAALCIQCNKCVLACPHATIRAKMVAPPDLAGAPAGFLAHPGRLPEFPGTAYTLQVAPDDCTGCGVCVTVCPAREKANPRHKALEMVARDDGLEERRAQWDYFLRLPEAARERVSHDVRGVQLLQPLFEFSGACQGCGETPYLKLLTQLFGDRLLIANATGCSSIYGGNLPTTPYTTNRDGRGPAWSNSLFEDNAEFGLGIRLAVDQLRGEARALVAARSSELGEDLASCLLDSPQDSESDIARAREAVTRLRELLFGRGDTASVRLQELADYLVRKSVWLVGGDGWAYDIGFGGLDHVLASGRDVNVLVLDTEVYSNTGGQQSKATPLGAAAKFAAAGKETRKKDLGLIAMAYGSVYVAHVAFGARDQQTVRAMQEAEAYPGPSLIIAYSHCIAHGYDLAFGPQQQKLAVESGAWPLYRYDPRRAAAGEPPLKLDCGPPRLPLRDYLRNEARFLVAEKLDPQRFARLMGAAEREARERFSLYEQLAGIRVEPADAAGVEG